MTIYLDEMPNIREGVNCFKTSDPTGEENCIAHACGARGEWWQPYPRRFWPLGPPYYNDKIESLIYLFKRRGYEDCGLNATYEEGYEKIAIYGKGGKYTHAARQLADGTWTSKLGPEDDVNHTTPEVVAGGTFGDVVKIMKLKRTEHERLACCECEGDKDGGKKEKSTIVEARQQDRPVL
ncbi:MAG: hypothetical protein ACLQNE_15430 [Thermoguttaceae bacterium]